MHRLAVALFALVCFLPPASAALSPPRSLLGRGDGSPLLARAVPDALLKAVDGGGQKDEFVLTDDTEVQLDGRPCKYADVPNNCSIVRLELAADGKTILKIHFRSTKK